VVREGRGLPILVLTIKKLPENLLVQKLASKSEDLGPKPYFGDIYEQMWNSKHP